MAKIAVIVSNPCTGDARVIKIAEAAHEMGHEVHIFATHKQGIESYEIKNGIHYHRLEWNLGKYLRDKLFFKVIKKLISSRLANYLVRKSVPFIKYKVFENIFIDSIAELNPNLVHAHDLICLPLGYNVAKKCNAKIVYDAHELEVHRHPPLPFLQKIYVSYIEKKFASKTDAVITVGEHISKILENELNREDINVIFNSPIIKKSFKNIRDDLNLTPHTRLIIYVGKVTPGRGVEDVISILPSLPNVHFATVGPCDPKVKIKMITLAKKLNVSQKFTLLPPVHYENVVEYIKGADMGITVAELKSLSYKLSMPNKLFEMSFANIPILAADFVEIGEYFEKYGNGRTINFEDKATNLYKISKFIEEKDRYILSDSKYKEIEKKYSWNVQKDKLSIIYKNLLEK